MQYVNVDAIPSRGDIEKFTFRVTINALRDLQPRLEHPVRVPEHISLMPTLIERFVNVFKQHIEQNPIYYVDQVQVISMKISVDLLKAVQCRHATFVEYIRKN